MIVEDQAATISLLMNPATHGDIAPVETIETHISRIFLVGHRAYKMKCAVRLPYVDFSTAEFRLAACKREVELNSQTAPGLYLGIRRITRDPTGQVVLDGTGALVDALVEKMRFGQSSLLDQMALVGELTPDLMTDVARMIVNFHRGAPPVHIVGGAANMAGVLDINAAGFATSQVFDSGEIARFDAAFRASLERHAALLDSRAVAGKIRRCHGDLHLRNICLLDGAPRLFDCIEFNDQIATIDVLYDLAFLLMDLWHRGFPDLANLVANRYFDATEDQEGFGLLPFFMAVRAAVRAHVTATQIAEGSCDRERLAAEARSYFDLARSLLQKIPPKLIAIGGLSGSGKTTIAEALAAHVGAPPGARIVESDRIRKAMQGVSPETRLPDSAYRPEISEKVYGEMARVAGIVLSEGASVVADAVFDRPADRDRLRRIAEDLHMPLQGVWLDADPDVLRRRVSERIGGPSDATVDVLSHQLVRRPGRTGWREIDATHTPAAIITAILEGCGTAADSSPP